MAAQSADRRKVVKRWALLLAAALAAAGLYQWLASPLGEKEKALRSGVRSAVEKQFPEEAAQAAEAYGLSRFDTDTDPAIPPPGSDRAVVLIHGLDEPGNIWMNLAPHLHRSGFDVWIMRYPNDQAITDSARLLFDHLKLLPLAGVRQVALVGHSMGGLVAREMLTSPIIDYAQLTAFGEVPQVVALVMVGTPNHGSELARFRLLTEVRDQLVQLTRGEANWLGGILDGAGEAKIDLLPESRFLTSLNGRPNPQEVKLLVIAGVASPWSEKEIDEFIARLRDRLPTESKTVLADLRRCLTSLTDNLGDGLVTVDSTRLEGALHRTVAGTHLTMIRNLSQHSDRVPPSVPIIVDFLEGVYAGGGV